MGTTSTTVEFCDTNVLVYAYGASGAKRDAAQALVDRLWAERRGCVSVQVLQEFYVVATRRLTPPVDPATARKIIEGLTLWQVVEPTAQDVLTAIDGAQRWQTSFWDAMLIATAIRAGATTIWTEDLKHSQSYDGVTVRNPFV